MQPIYETLANEEINEVVARFADVLRNECNGETLLVGTCILVRDMEVLDRVVNGDELRKVVLHWAEKDGQYAGMLYDPNDFLEPEHQYFSAPDDGLSWVGFEDMYQAFIKVAKSFQ